MVSLNVSLTSHSFLQSLVEPLLRKASPSALPSPRSVVVSVASTLPASRLALTHHATVSFRILCILARREQPHSPPPLSLLPYLFLRRLSVMSKVHCSPEDAVELHVAVKSKKSIGEPHFHSPAVPRRSLSTSAPLLLHEVTLRSPKLTPYRPGTSSGIHWATWVLTDEEMTEPPKRLRAACEVKGITPEQFGVCAIGESYTCLASEQGSPAMI